MVFFFTGGGVLVDGNSCWSWENRIVMMPTLSPLAVPMVVITTAYGANSDGNVDVMITWCRTIQLKRLSFSQSQIKHTANLFRQEKQIWNRGIGVKWPGIRRTQVFVMLLTVYPKSNVLCNYINTFHIEKVENKLVITNNFQWSLSPGASFTLRD